MVYKEGFGRGLPFTAKAEGLSFSKKMEKMISGKTLIWTGWIGVVLLAVSIAITRLFELREVTLALSAFSLFTGLVLINLVRSWAKKRGITNPTPIPSSYVDFAAAVIGGLGSGSMDISPLGILAITVMLLGLTWRRISQLDSRISQDIRELRTDITDIRENIGELRTRIDKDIGELRTDIKELRTRIGEIIQRLPSAKG